MESQSSKTPRPVKPRGKGKWIALLLVLAGIAVAYQFFGGESELQDRGTVYTAQRGNLEITVLEGGTIAAENSLELKSEVQGQTKILSIVEEGYFITPDDVAEELLLVELDPKELLDQQVSQELDYQNSLASFTEAREEYAIQENQNESDLKKAELDAKFAQMDFEKYLGEEVATEIIAEIGLDVPIREEANAAASEEEAADDSAGDVLLDGPSIVSIESSVSDRPEIDFSQYADPEKLGDGAARQELRKMEDDLVLAGEEVGLALTQVEGTKRLFESDFVTKNELDNDEMKLTRQQISEDAASTSKELFIKYEFPKEAERLLSEYEESLRKLERAHRTAISKMAQAEAKLNSAQARFTLQEQRRNEIQEQLSKCTIRATQTGLVVYGEEGRSYWRDDQRIEEGATVRERQVIITIPDTTRMVVNVSVHESMVKRVEKGQPARVKVDAFPDENLTGEVIKIGVLPDSQNRWMNPDLKVYSTEIRIDDTHDWLKPGMSSEAEIIVETLRDVIYVPLLAVANEGEEQVVYVDRLGGPERRVIEAGEYNETHIAILSGLDEGERVLLRTPTAAGGEENAEPSPSEGEDSDSSSSAEAA